MGCVEDFVGKRKKLGGGRGLYTKECLSMNHCWKSDDVRSSSGGNSSVFLPFELQ